MSNTFFQFKQFIIHQDRCAMKVTTDGCLFGAFCARQLREMPEKNRARMLDVGTGTGLLSLMMAQQLPVVIDAIEIDAEAAQQAGENMAASPWADRLHVISADVTEYAFTHRYDIIVSNPPFYENELRAPDRQKNMAHHDTGLRMEDLLRAIKTNLAKEGVFFLLLPFKRDKEIASLLTSLQLTATQTILAKQTTTHTPFRIMLMGTHLENASVSFLTNEVSIKDERNEYTVEFKNLLRYYYLAL